VGIDLNNEWRALRGVSPHVHITEALDAGGRSPCDAMWYWKTGRVDAVVDGRYAHK
jgi:hypothetical protein